MKTPAAVLVVFFAVVVSASAAFGQDAPEPTIPAAPTVSADDPALPPPVSLPPGIPTVDPRVGTPADPAVEEPPPVEPLDDPSPKVAVVIAQLHVLDVEKALDGAQAVLAAAATEEVGARARRDAVKRDRDAKRQVLTDLATDAYVNGNIQDAGTETMAEYMPAESARLLTSSAIDQNVAELQEAEDRLQSMERALSDVVAKRESARSARDAAKGAVDEAVLAVSEARRLTNAKDVSPTVLGDAVMTAEEIAGWFKAKGVVGYAATVDLPTLVGYYLEEGKAEKVRGDVAFAQSIVETGAFTSPLTTHHNFAGIGACDSCPTGFDFPSPRHGVRAQAQLLHAYADSTLRIATLANPAVGSNPDRLSVRGCCPTWNKLTGTWATDPNYGPKLMTVYLSMLEFALQERTKPPTTPPAAAPLPAVPGP